jgi:hypothetical protein
MEYIPVRVSDVKRHLIPDLPAYGLDSFEEFSTGRTALIVTALKRL